MLPANGAKKRPDLVRAPDFSGLRAFCQPSFFRFRRRYSSSFVFTFSGISLETGHFTASAMARVKSARKLMSKTICVSDRRASVSYRLWISAWLFGAIRAKESAGTPLSAKGVESLEYTSCRAYRPQPRSAQ